MARFTVTVVIDTDSAEHAHDVIRERIGYDEDLGFDYTIDTLSDLTEIDD